MEEGESQSDQDGGWRDLPLIKPGDYISVRLCAISSMDIHHHGVELP